MVNGKWDSKQLKLKYIFSIYTEPYNISRYQYVCSTCNLVIYWTGEGIMVNELLDFNNEKENWKKTFTR